MEESQAIIHKWVEYPNQLYTDYDYHTDAHVAEKAEPQLVNSGQFVTFWSPFVLGLQNVLAEHSFGKSRLQVSSTP